VDRYLLFIDTETSDKPYIGGASLKGSDHQLFAVQISWLLYTLEGIKIKEENHYICNNDFTISRSAQKIHGITRDFLNGYGENRTSIMALLAADLCQYKPLVVGHFMELDRLVTGIEFQRTGIADPMEKLPTFCTMEATTHLCQNPVRKYLRLPDLYDLLFHQPMQNLHNALSDAKATAECFFELLQKGQINEEKIYGQQNAPGKVNSTNPGKGFFHAGLIIILILSIAFILWKQSSNY
jgi:DNA polymerase-3 subunit epsilon